MANLTGRRKGAEKTPVHGAVKQMLQAAGIWEHLQFPGTKKRTTTPKKAAALARASARARAGKPSPLAARQDNIYTLMGKRGISYGEASRMVDRMGQAAGATAGSKRATKKSSTSRKSKKTQTRKAKVRKVQRKVMKRNPGLGNKASRARARKVVKSRG